MLDVGFENRYGTSRCPVCSKIRPSNAIWFASVYFAPYDDSLSETTVEELLYQLTA